MFIHHYSVKHLAHYLTKNLAGVNGIGLSYFPYNPLPELWYCKSHYTMSHLFPVFLKLFLPGEWPSPSRLEKEVNIAFQTWSGNNKDTGRKQENQRGFIWHGLAFRHAYSVLNLETNLLAGLCASRMKEKRCTGRKEQILFQKYTSLLWSHSRCSPLHQRFPRSQ